MLNACHSCRHFASEASPCLLCLPIPLLELLFSSYPLVCLETPWPWLLPWPPHPSFWLFLPLWPDSLLLALFLPLWSLFYCFQLLSVVFLKVSLFIYCFSSSTKYFWLILFLICGSCDHQCVDNLQTDLSKIYGIPGAQCQLSPEHQSVGFSNFTCLNILISSLWGLSYPQPQTGNCIWFPSSVQFSCSVTADSLRLHGLQYTRLPCPSPTPGAYLNSCPLSWWCHPTISSSVVPFSCLQSVNNVFLVLTSKA